MWNLLCSYFLSLIFSFNSSNLLEMFSTVFFFFFWLSFSALTSVWGFCFKISISLLNFSSILVSFSFVLLTLLWTFWIDFFSLFSFVYVSSLKSPNIFEVKFLILGLTLQQSQYLCVLKLKSYDFLETLCCLAFLVSVLWLLYLLYWISLKILWVL